MNRINAVRPKGQELILTRFQAGIAGSVPDTVTLMGVTGNGSEVFTQSFDRGDFLAGVRGEFPELGAPAPTWETLDIRLPKPGQMVLLANRTEAAWGSLTPDGKFWEYKVRQTVFRVSVQSSPFTHWCLIKLPGA